MNIHISKDKSQLDIDLIHSFITDSYWAKGRSKSDMIKCIEHAVCFGIYDDRQQIGFARLLTDWVVFAYLMDVFIDPDYRGKGLGDQLMQYILNDPDFCQVKSWYLKTKDADKFYYQYGFRWIDSGPLFMERIQK